MRAFFRWAALVAAACLPCVGCYALVGLPAEDGPTLPLLGPPQEPTPTVAELRRWLGPNPSFRLYERLGERPAGYDHVEVWVRAERCAIPSRGRDACRGYCVFGVERVRLDGRVLVRVRTVRFEEE